MVYAQRNDDGTLINGNKGVGTRFSIWQALKLKSSTAGVFNIFYYTDIDKISWGIDGGWSLTPQAVPIHEF